MRGTIARGAARTCLVRLLGNHNIWEPQHVVNIAGRSSLTVAIGKQAFYSQIELDQPRAYAYAKEVMSMNAAAYDAQEGITAFLEKRPACWQGR